MQLTVFDWNKLSSNDHVGDANLTVEELLADMPKKDPNTRWYPEDNDRTQDSMKEFMLLLQIDTPMSW